ncbi:MAG: methyltransferase domain-containing protein [Deltaproteobacteria bacterium]|jgi:ubiquinone/menaquinone biosynthesis C-methylase UbiE|nr:methyltransferase domain-containing protein [Deltaproteobacteria bacterium]
MTTETELLKNWEDSTDRYSNLVNSELNSFKREAWLKIISENVETLESLKVLDVGTGPGFFAIILSQAGSQVRAVDYTETMVEAARANAEKLDLKIDFQKADSQDLPFDDNTFDLVISRNVAWTLIDAEKAYREWKRVLKPKGSTLIFDANWNYDLFNEERHAAVLKDYEECRVRFPEQPLHIFTPEMIEFRRKMPQCARLRPNWDLGALLDAGFSKIYCEANISSRVYTESEQLMYRSSPMFLIKAEKS